MPKPLCPQKKTQIVELLKDDALSIADIAKTAAVDPKTVAKLKRKRQDEINGPFYSERLKAISAADLLKIAQDSAYDPSPDTTKVKDDQDIPVLPDHLLEKHRVPDFSLEAKNALRQKYLGDGKDFHGFWIYPRDKSYDREAVDGLLAPMEKDSATMGFTSIFEYTQKVKATEDQRKQGLSSEDARFGDNLRKHLVWEVLLENLRTRLKEDKASVNRLRQELKEAQDRLKAFSAAVDPAKERKTRGTMSTVQKHAETAESEARKVKEAQNSLDDAERALAEALEFRKNTEKVQKVLCDNYRRIIRHSPYGGMGVENSINDRRLLSIILSLPDAGSQTMHGDSLQPGCSLLMSARKRQYLIILANGFRAMRSMERMLLRRGEALEYVRDRIAKDAPGGLRSWSVKAEHRVWNYLCCLQFEHEGIGAIQAFRVPIEEGETLVVDNRTLHGGSRGEATPGFRFHAYGYVRDIQMRGVGLIEQDQDFTIDPLENGFFPVCRWAQIAGRSPVFRV